MFRDLWILWPHYSDFCLVLYSHVWFKMMYSLKLVIIAETKRKHLLLFNIFSYIHYVACWMNSLLSLNAAVGWFVFTNLPLTFPVFPCNTSPTSIVKFLDVCTHTVNITFDRVRHRPTATKENWSVCVCFVLFLLYISKCGLVLLPAKSGPIGLLVFTLDSAPGGWSSIQYFFSHWMACIISLLICQDWQSTTEHNAMVTIAYQKLLWHVCCLDGCNSLKAWMILFHRTCIHL